MSNSQATFGLVPLGPGDHRPLTDTVRGIGINERDVLGKVYWGAAADGTRRAYKIVKNASGGTLTKGYVLKYSLTAGRYGIDVLHATADLGPVAGVVDDSYIDGVPDGRYFRMVIYAELIELRLGTTSDARCTLAVGDVIVSNADDGMVWKTDGSAAGVQNRVGFAKEATTNAGAAPTNGAYFDCEVNLLR